MLSFLPLILLVAAVAIWAYWRAGRSLASERLIGEDSGGDAFGE